MLNQPQLLIHSRFFAFISKASHANFALCFSALMRWFNWYQICLALIRFGLRGSEMFLDRILGKGDPNCQESGLAPLFWCQIFFVVSEAGAAVRFTEACTCPPTPQMQLGLLELSLRLEEESFESHHCRWMCQYNPLILKDTMVSEAGSVRLYAIMWWCPTH
jgi:hypothetical protein